MTEETLLALAESLRSDGWCYRPRFLDDATVAALRADIEQRRSEFSTAAIGRAQQRRQEQAIRADKTLWLTAASSAQRTFLAAMEELRATLNRHLLLGLHDYEAHYAHYAAGAFYRRHLDTFNALDVVHNGEPKSRRVLSTICYLNACWQRGDGGELVLYDRHDREINRIEPRGGGAVFFLSDEFPHEVRPALTDRYSIAGWFRNRGGA